MEQHWRLEKNSVTTAANTCRLGLVLITISAIAWSTAGLFTRMIPLDQWTLLAWRGVFGGLGILAFMIFQNRSTWSNDIMTVGMHGWLYAGVSALGMIFFITSLRFTSVAHVAIIYATIPFLAAALAWISLNETPTRSAIVASLAALVGVVLMVSV